MIIFFKKNFYFVWVKLVLIWGYKVRLYWWCLIIRVMVIIMIIVFYFWWFMWGVVCVWSICDIYGVFVIGRDIVI